MLRNVEETMRSDADFIKYLNPSSVVLGNDFVGPLSEVAGASSAMYEPTYSTLIAPPYCPRCAHPVQPLMLPSRAGRSCTRRVHRTTCVNFCTTPGFYFPTISGFVFLPFPAFFCLLWFWPCCKVHTHTRVRCTIKVEEQQGKDPLIHDPLGNKYQVVLQPPACCVECWSQCNVESRKLRKASRIK